nr:MCE family protein [Parabacteroides sp.]
VEISLEEEMKINKGSYITIVRSLLSGGELHIHLNKYVKDYLQTGGTIEGRMSDDIMGTVQDKLLPQVIELMPKIDSILLGLQTIVNHPALIQSLNQIERTTGNLEASTQQLNRLLNKDVPVIVSDLKIITSNFAEVSTELKGLDLQTTYNSMNAMMNNLKLTTDRLNSTDNSMGLLLNDKALYENLNSTADNAAKLMIDLKQNPKRYVRFSVF